MTRSTPPEASTATADVIVVGAGFGGLYALHKLRTSGLTTLALEAAPSVGGTWWANRYPGARVDIQSLEYSYSFDEPLQQQWRWSERYASQPELLRYANHVADRFDLRRDIRLNTRVEQAHFDEATARWRVRSADGRQWNARFVVMAIGPLSTPNTPAFDGLRSFEGPVLHSAQWPHEPVDFSGRDVAVIGTGSSAVQMIPIIAERARTLTVFQRTAAYAVPAHNGPLDPEREARIKADYAGFRARNRRMRAGFGSELAPHPLPTMQVSAQEREAQFEERWRIGGFSLIGAFVDTLTDLRANDACAEFVRGKIRSIVRDPVVAQRLCPTHPIACKRLCVDSGYYDTYNRANVSLVDVSGAPIERITPHGLVSGGCEHRFDMLVLATGFDAFTGPLTRIDLRGRDGLHIGDKWRGGPLNYLGLMVAGFPNLFNLVGPGSTSAFTSVITAIEQHVDWIADCIAWLDARGHRTIEANDEAEAHWVQWVNQVAAQTVFLSCNSWYLGANIPGKPRVFMPLAGGFPAYADRCAAVARDGYTGFVAR
ncbi:MAG TPA: NAD(P)/FAD-dependent oxidoreductase [Burkholderiaceae bacterium]|nr:NAD(P)/FAD-dependent oxidoreductase [Burkholderiaceae bacterium]